MLRAKVDTNQKVIVAALRKAGAVVYPVHRLKKFFDILVYFRGKIFSMEIKSDEKQKLTEGEQECKLQIESTGNRYYVVTSPDQAIRIIYGNTL